MRYTVLHVAYPFTAVGEDSVGGSEQILTLIDRAMVRAGHDSIVIAAEGSKVSGTLIPSSPANSTLDSKVRKRGQHEHRRLIRDALSRYAIDLVHMHGLDFHQYLPEADTPVLATLHLPPDWYPDEIYRLKRPHFHLNCVSLSQERMCPDSSRLLPTIPNGVDIRRLQGRSKKRDYALALGRICPEKGFHFALDAAKQAGVDLLLAGEVSPYAAIKEYVRKKIMPRLDERRQFIGPVGFNAKRRLLLQARCLLVPSTVQETSSLVSMEAMAAGTPVIAFRSGALPEIIEHGKTGYLVSNAQEMAKAIAAVDKLAPEECRKTAVRRFSEEKMVERYVQTYHRIISRTSTQPERALGMPATSWLVS
jgi:glycosyltransferase involved in cell wall biosynthesis